MQDEGKGKQDAREQAIAWWVARRAGPLAPQEEAAFHDWLARDPAHAAAFADIAGMVRHVRGMTPSPRVAAGRFRPVAAALAAAAAALALWIGFDDLSILLRADRATGVGETRSVTLDDGSRIHLDARSAIALRYGDAERRVVLLRGEALFEVASDRARPFVVEAAEGTVAARGTAFDIALTGAGARVTVTEHAVEVASGGGALLLGEGRQTSYARAGAAEAPRSVDVDAATAWRRGKLIIEDAPLSEALAALARHRRGYVFCLRPKDCARRVTGVFGAGDPLRALREIEASLGLTATFLTDYLIVLHR
ncbi:FecR domain-containing protein [Methylosinus sp. Sm6]|uniref:FecR family protein n=1 Tax=Methylosinus sp. Sm6 TaxID=2866948 RepID=UPI001C98F1B9|nr:FecR domain-containing protein [Methylosinus sp. Sm6]MBY6243815.1 FecR domain-containing protein [Methylosinus sp. Sm6]